MIKYKNKILILGFIGILIIGFGTWDTVSAADSSVYVLPAQANKEIGSTFNITVKVNPDGQKVCAVEGKLSLTKLSCQKVTMGSGLSAQTSPSCDDLSFLLGIQGCVTNKKTLFTVRVKAKNAGSGIAKFTGVDIIGEGISISSNSSGGSYTITSSCNCGAWSVWQDGDCGGGSCSSNQRLQTRTRVCTPLGCKSKNEYQCKDDPGCISQIPTIEIDVIPPVITLIGSSTVNFYVGNIYKDDGSTALDNVDGDITANIATVNSVDRTTVGTYTVTYNVSDAAGNPAEEVTRIVIVNATRTDIIKVESPRPNLLANLGMIWKEITQSLFLTMAVILCLVGSMFIGIKEWRLFRKKKH